VLPELWVNESLAGAILLPTWFGSLDLAEYKDVARTFVHHTRAPLDVHQPDHSKSAIVLGAMPASGDVSLARWSTTSQNSLGSVVIWLAPTIRHLASATSLSRTSISVKVKATIRPLLGAALAIMVSQRMLRRGLSQGAEERLPVGKIQTADGGSSRKPDGGVLYTPIFQRVA